jgi:hypothetical protein
MRSTGYRTSICLLLCGALMAGAHAVRAGQAATRNAPIKTLHVTELVAGFHLLYELKPEEARGEFEALEKLHPEDPLGSASDAARAPLSELVAEFPDNPLFSSELTKLRLSSAGVILPHK